MQCFNRNQTFFDQNRYHLTQFFKIEIITQNKDKIRGKTPKGNIKTDISVQKISKIFIH